MTCKFNYYCVHCIVYYIQKFICKKNSKYLNAFNVSRIFNQNYGMNMYSNTCILKLN